MIITKTPYRISFFGGGSDYPEWLERYDGKVLSTTIDKYLYISCRKLPKFFNHKYRIVWSKIENVKNINQIKHAVVKKLLLYNKINTGLEIHYDGDLPARSGMGSSSSFSVGLMKALCKLKKKEISNLNLAKKVIFFEQKILKEHVGSQDQIAASIGGFNKISFFKNKKIVVKNIKGNNLKKLNSNLLLIYTGLQRTAQNIAKKYVKKLTNKKQANINRIIEYVDEAENLIESGRLSDFGKLLNEAWNEKKGLSSYITNSRIDSMYEIALKNGALGGKILGAGGGGFLLLYVKKENQKKILNKMKNIVHVPFKFSNTGTKIILDT